MDDGLVIRPEEPGDYPRIAEVVRRAFGSEVEVELVGFLRRSGGYLPGLALVAVSGGEVVGHVMITRAELIEEGSGSRRAAVLSPLAVHPDHQRRGIGSELVRAATAVAEARGEPAVVLQGSPVYYRRFGFEPSAPLGITMELPSWAPPEAAQVLRLSRYDPSLRGRLHFAALDEVAPHDDIREGEERS